MVSLNKVTDSNLKTKSEDPTVTLSSKYAILHQGKKEKQKLKAHIKEILK